MFRASGSSSSGVHFFTLYRQSLAYCVLDDTVHIRNRNSLITIVRHKINNFPSVWTKHLTAQLTFTNHMSYTRMYDMWLVKVSWAVKCFVLSFIYQCLGTLCLFHLHRRVGVKKFPTYQPMKMEHTECSETSAYKIQTPGNYREESIQ